MLSEDKLLNVKNLRKYFPVRKGIFKGVVGYIKAVDDVSFSLRRGDTLGIVGESGCGKTTVARTILRLLKPTTGEIYFRSRNSTGASRVGQEVNLGKASAKTLKAMRRDLQIIFQDPYSSLDPRKTVQDIVGEPLYVFKVGNRQDRADQVADLLLTVGLKPDFMKRYPHEFSGGQRQRIGIARALALHPQLVIADESVSALDVSIQAQVLNLLQDLQEKFKLTYIVIAHNLSVIKYISERVAVMYLGRIVEMASTELLFSNPRHPYTEALMSAVMIADPCWRPQRIKLQGDVPSPFNPPPGCHFQPRCHRAKSICAKETPAFCDLGGGHLVACHFV